MYSLIQKCSLRIKLVLKISQKSHFENKNPIKNVYVKYVILVVSNIELAPHNYPIYGFFRNLKRNAVNAKL